MRNELRVSDVELRNRRKSFSPAGQTTATSLWLLLNREWNERFQEQPVPKAAASVDKIDSSAAVIMMGNVGASLPHGLRAEVHVSD